MMNTMQIVISSFNSDFFQLINKNTFILRYKGKQTMILDPKNFYEKYGILPQYFADYKSMVGDTADNINLKIKHQYRYLFVSYYLI